MLADAGLVDVDLRAKVSLMRGGRPSAEWYVGAVERALPGLVDVGRLTQAQADASMAQGRDPALLPAVAGAGERVGAETGLISTDSLARLAQPR